VGEPQRAGGAIAGREPFEFDVKGPFFFSAMTAFFDGPSCIPRRSPAKVRLLIIAALVFGPLARPIWAADGPLLDPTPLSSSESDRINNSARGLAGETSSDGTWQTTPEWKSYESWFDGRWSYIQRVRLTAMRSWAGSALGSLPSDTVYYPFSGPDFLYADTFFPDAKILIMAGLEPIGTMPDLEQLKKEGRLDACLQQMKTSLFTILAASFFKTKDMQTDFHNQFDGLLPVIAVFLARENCTIESLRYVSLGHDGTLHPHEPDGATGVQITYSGGRTLLYFQANLANDGLEENPGFIRLMQRTGPGTTYLKAASYLLYDDYFSTMRNAILNYSGGVLEDDSGIPLRDFKPAQWEVTPYGNYTGPIALFSQNYQPDLAQFYTNHAHAPLPFGSGYKFNASISSLLVARKVK
jgi:hypothetical protein